MADLRRADLPTDEPPPIGGSWGFLYAVVAGALALWILLSYAFGRAFL